MGDFKNLAIISSDVQFDPERRLLKINGKHYRIDENDAGRGILLEVNLKKMDKMVGKVLSDTISALDKERLLKYCLYKMSYGDLEKIFKKLTDNKRKRRPSMKTGDGCVELNVGGVSIPLAD